MVSLSYILSQTDAWIKGHSFRNEESGRICYIEIKYQGQSQNKEIYSHVMYYISDEDKCHKRFRLYMSLSSLRETCWTIIDKSYQ